MYLNCHTSLSFRYGTLSVEELFNEARRCGVSKLALTEINNTASYVEMLRLCRQHEPVANGISLMGTPAYHLDIAAGIEVRRENELLFVALARNNEGFEELNRFASYHNANEKAIPKRAPEFTNVFVVYPFGKVEPESLRPFEYVGVRISDLNHLALYEAYFRFKDKFVILQPVTFAD